MQARVITRLAVVALTGALFFTGGVAGAAPAGHPTPSSEPLVMLDTAATATPAQATARPKKAKATKAKGPSAKGKAATARRAPPKAAKLAGGPCTNTGRAVAHGKSRPKAKPVARR